MLNYQVLVSELSSLRHNHSMGSSESAQLANDEIRKLQNDYAVGWIILILKPDNSALHFIKI